MPKYAPIPQDKSGGSKQNRSVPQMSGKCKAKNTRQCLKRKEIRRPSYQRKAVRGKENAYPGWVKWRYWVEKQNRAQSDLSHIEVNHTRVSSKTRRGVGR